MELYNIEAEQSILGAILIEPKSISEGNEVNLSSSDFISISTKSSTSV